MIDFDTIKKISLRYKKIYNISDPDIEDIISDTYLKYQLCIINNIIDADESKHFSYVKTIFKNKCIDLIRKKKINSIEECDCIRTTEDILDEVYTTINIDKILLIDKEKILYDRYILGESIDTISKKLKQSRSIINKKIAKLKKEAKNAIQNRKQL